MSLKDRMLEEISCLGSLPISLLAVAYYGSLRLFLALIATMAIVYAIRILAPKNRPDGSKPPEGLLRLDYSSFPSMHAARITLLSLSIFGAFKAIPLILLTSLSRLLLRRHDLPDLAGGLMVGSIAYAVIICT